MPRAAETDGTTGEAAPDSIFREGRNRSSSGPGWQVVLRRQGRVIARSFRDSVHGGSDAALASAIAYRDAVMATVPPATNHAQATKLRRNNESGISGVGRRDADGRVTWIATLMTREGQRLRRFPVDRYGEDGARARAIAQRRAWLETLPPRFLSHTATAREITGRAFGDGPAPAADVFEQPSMPEADLDARLAAIDARFDALRPARLRVRTRSYAPGTLSIAVSDGGRPARRALAQVRYRTRTLPEALEDARDRLRTMIADLHGPAAAEWFLREHGAALLDPASFDVGEGFNLCLMVPPKTLREEA